jgi:hypothetical protein
MRNFSWYHIFRYPFNWYGLTDMGYAIKHAWQRVRRGYDDRVCWGFDSYFITIIPALKKFCKDELNGSATEELNPERYRIFTRTLELIEDYEKRDQETWIEGKTEIPALFSYVGENLLYYWD